MKQIVFWIFLFGLTFSSCHSNKQPKSKVESKTKAASNVVKPIETKATIDKIEVEKLIKGVLKWTETRNSFDLLPVRAEEGDSIYNGFDLEKHKQNLIILERTNFFAKEFIENYNQIILTFDRKLRANEFDYPWYIGEPGPFTFGNYVDPWTHSQEIPHDLSVVWDLVEVRHLQDETYQWVWGGLTSEHHPSWKDFSYKFKVTMENSILKISYLEGFDIKQVIKE